MSHLPQADFWPLVLVANDQFDFLDALHAAVEEHPYLFQAYFLHPGLPLVVKRERPDIVVLRLQAISADICREVLHKLHQQWCTRLIPVILYCEDEDLLASFVEFSAPYHTILVSSPVSIKALMLVIVRLITIRVALYGVYRNQPLLATIDRLEQAFDDLNRLQAGTHPVQQPQLRPSEP